MKDFFEARRPHNGLTYEAYLAALEELPLRPLTGLDVKQRRRLFYIRYNRERSERVHQAYRVSEALREAVTALEEPQLWMVLTEAWCADSAFSLPVIAEAARVNHLIDLRILWRDENLDVMDRYLTGAARSIPKLVAFSLDGDERFQWGPRPEGARRLRQDLILQGYEGRDVSKKLIDYYEAGGWRRVDDELTAALHRSVPAAVKGS